MIEAVAAQQPAIRSIVRTDIRRLNDLPDARYGVFGWVQGTHGAGVENDLLRCDFSLFYVDRLTAGKTNAVEVQSTGCEVLGSILRYIAEGTDAVDVDSWTLHPFAYRFKDECAGVWAEVSIRVPVSLPCGAVYEELENVGDFNADFNEDFSCWVTRVGEKEIRIY